MNIFFDVDETLVRTHQNFKKKQNRPFCPHAHVLPHDATMSSVERPCAKQLIRFAQNLVGADRVFLLSIGVREYIVDLNKFFEWGIDPMNIYAREDLEECIRHIPLAYGGEFTEVDPIIFANKNNVLIDNLPRTINQVKIELIGILSTMETNYLATRDYQGSLSKTQDELFYHRVTNFLQSRYEASQSNGQDNSTSESGVDAH